MFSDFMTDKIFIIKKDGTKSKELKASVQSNKIHLDDISVLIEPNDIVERIMSNGGIEQYQVIDPCFYVAFHGISAHYQMKVRKIGLPQKQTTPQTVYNIGDNA